MAVFPSIDNEKGAPLLELAVTLPWLLLIVFGLVDFGFALREVQLLSDASRQAARVAGVFAGNTGSPPQLKRCKTASLSQSCGSGARPVNIRPNFAVDRAAKESACNYLSANGLDLSQWLVQPSIIDATEDGIDLTFVKVTIKRNNNSPACLICYLEAFKNIFSETRSVFPLQSLQGCRT